MKNLQIHVASVIFALALSSAAGAQQPDLEVTMDVVPHSASPGAVTGEIALPDAASARARDAAAFGLGTANKAREMKGDLGREFGREVSQGARERPPLPKPSVPAKK
jgi:hypothetical protein